MSLLTVQDLIDVLQKVDNKSQRVYLEMRTVDNVYADPKGHGIDIQPVYEKCVICNTKIKNEGVTVNGGIAHKVCAKRKEG